MNLEYPDTVQYLIKSKFLFNGVSICPSDCSSTLLFEFFHDESSPHHPFENNTIVYVVTRTPLNNIFNFKKSLFSNWLNVKSRWILRCRFFFLFHSLVINHILLFHATLYT